jgi:hypothetical protein
VLYQGLTKLAGLGKDAKNLVNMFIQLSPRLYHIPQENQTKTESKHKTLSFAPSRLCGI